MEFEGTIESGVSGMDKVLTVFWELRIEAAETLKSHCSGHTGNGFATYEHCTQWAVADKAKECPPIDRLYAAKPCKSIKSNIGVWFFHSS
ncbi:hypothetical protein N7471_003399 [Penicillium samsonianum]|uniref:uncharacterized protein n=1 Tax=Penicillium samsonianum TaxID=1882272 RepID=UPI0025467DE7|nr:uncharacterized protein N7471_003399 [Penicillium samsonianum]KAJ6143946.1 hypothetical protein N7471_003399 [Penicillium samsonianum]